MSGRAVEAAGDVDTLLLDKTGTITFGNRMATEVIPVPGVAEREAAEAALLASLADETPEGRSIVDAGPGEVPVPRCRGARRRSRLHRVLGDDAPVGRRSRRPQAAQGRRRRRAQVRQRDSDGRDRRAAGVPRRRRTHRPLRRHAAGLTDGGRLLGVIHLRTWSSPDIKERFARAAPHGHQDGDDHRRQPGHRGGHRLRGRRRRLRRRGDAGGQAALHPRRAGARAG